MVPEGKGIATMKRILVLIHDGFEEMEALTPVDLCRRAGLSVDLCSMTGRNLLKGARGITVGTDLLFEEADLDSYDAVILPGGLPNATSLRDDERVMRVLADYAAADKWIGAICAAPIALERAGLLKKRRATSYPGCLQDECACYYETIPVCVDGRLITSRGAGTAIHFALNFIENLVSAEKAREIAASIMLPAENTI